MTQPDSADGKKTLAELEHRLSECLEAETTLRNDLQRFKKIIERSFDGIVIHANGKVVFINEAGAAMFGIGSPENAIGRDVTGFIHPDYIPAALDRMKKIFDDNEVAPLMEVSLLDVDGNEFDAEVIAIPITYESKPSSLVVFRDITERKEMEDALRESEELHRVILESISDAVFITDDNGKFVYICPNVDVIFGYSGKETAEFGNISGLFGSMPIDKEMLKEKGEMENIEHDISDKTGKMRTILVNAKKVAIGNGTILYTCHDITDRKRAEVALRNSEERLSISLGASGIVGSWEWTIENDSFNVDDRYVTMLGFNTDELGQIISREQFERLVHPDDLQRINNSIHRHVTGEIDRYECEYRMRTKDGGWKTIFSRGKVTEYIKSGEPSRIYGVHVDITDRIEVEERMRNIAKFPVENPNPVLRIDAGGTLVFANEASGGLLDMWSCREGDAVPEDITSLINNVLTTEMKADKDVEYHDRIVSLSFVPVPDGGYVNIYGHDVTEQRRAEVERRDLEAQIQHAQKLESLGVLAGGIAHDFNNILVGILGNSDLALMELSPVSPARESVEEIKRAAVRASELTNQMLAYSGKGRFIIEAININELVREMTHMLEISISKKARLSFSFTDDIPYIEADASQIRQIIMNLLTNASDALEDRQGTISISTTVMEADRQYLDDLMIDERLPEGKYVVIEVTDTGIGMGEETIAKIFDPFFSTKFTGRGLGLSAVLGIVRGHQGAIKVYSEPGKGTAFKVLFPASFKMEKKRNIQCESENTQMFGSGTILVVDDEPSVLKVVRRMMEKFGYSVMTASDGREGLETFKKKSNEIILVLLDMTMPHLSGEELFREIKKIRKDVPVILTSGFNEQDATNRFAGKGLAGFIQKPFQLAKLAEKIRVALEK